MNSKKVRYAFYEPSPEVEKEIRERKVLLIDNAAAEELLSMEDSLDILEEAIREEGMGAAANRTKAVIHVPSGREGAWLQYATMEGGVKKYAVAATRIRSHIHTQPLAHGQKRVEKYCVAPGKYGGLVLLFSAGDGSLLAIMNDGHIQHMRVAATSGLSVKAMAREDAEVLCVLGAGGMATTHAWAAATARRLKEIRVYSPNPAHRKKFAEQLGEDLSIETIPTGDPESAIRGADIVMACTNSFSPVVPGDLLEPGMHVTTVIHWEMDDQALSRLDRYVLYRSAPAAHHFTTPEDFRPASLGGSDIETEKRERRLIGPEKIFPLADVLLGKVKGRESGEEITGFNSEGTGVQFAALANRVYLLAKERGLGRELPLSWFVQDIMS